MAPFAQSGQLVSHFVWEAINAACYLAGGAIFIAGSVYFLPGRDDAIGSWLYVVGSILFMVVSLHDGWEMVNHMMDDASESSNSQDEESSKSSDSKGRSSQSGIVLDASSMLVYNAGAGTFIAGSIFYLPSRQQYDEGAWCFIVGSCCFIAGAVFNAMQIFEADQLWVARNMNMVASCYLIGSTLFLAGSVPYLIPLESESDRRRLDWFLAWTFIVGSVFFFLGGLIHFARACKVLKDDFKRMKNLAPDNYEGKLIP